jgi:hypothetical protein
MMKPKDYGIMDWLVPLQSTLRDLFRFLLASPFAHPLLLLSFFRFFFWKNDLRSEAEQNNSRKQEKRTKHNSKLLNRMT